MIRRLNLARRQAEIPLNAYAKIRDHHASPVAYVTSEPIGQTIRDMPSWRRSSARWHWRPVCVGWSQRRSLCTMTRSIRISEEF